MNLSHIKITPALLLAAGTSIITLLVSVVPAWAPEKQLLITILGSVLTAGGLLANGLHKLGDSNVSARDVEQGAINAGRGAVQDALSHVDLNAVAKEAVNAQSLPDLEALAKAEVQRALSGLSLQFAPGQSQAQVQPEPAPVVHPAPVVPPAQ